MRIRTSATRSSPRRSTACRARRARPRESSRPRRDVHSRCRDRRDVPDEALRRLQRPEPEREHGHPGPGSARAVPDPVRGWLRERRAAATMCSYQVWRDTSTNPLLGTTLSALSSDEPVRGRGREPADVDAQRVALLVRAAAEPQLRRCATCGARPAFVGSDYPATHSTSAITKVRIRRCRPRTASSPAATAPTTRPAARAPTTPGNPGGFTPGLWDPDCTSDSAHIGGIPNGFEGRNAGRRLPGSGECDRLRRLHPEPGRAARRASRCRSSTSRWRGSSTRSSASGCSAATRLPARRCTNPGGVGADRSGTAPLPLGPDSGRPCSGTKNGDAAIVEKYSEEGATLLKNDGNALPLTAADLAGGVLVTGSSANHTVADPTNEASTGLHRPRRGQPAAAAQGSLSGNPGAFTFVPANDPTGAARARPRRSRRTATTDRRPATLSVDGPDAAATRRRAPIDYTTVSTAGQLAVQQATRGPATSTCRPPTRTRSQFQQSSSVPNANVTFAFGGRREPGDRRTVRARWRTRRTSTAQRSRARRRTPATPRRC